MLLKLKVNLIKILMWKYGKLSESFFKLGDIQKEINELCSDEYTLKTIFGEGQDATFILEKNS